MTISESILPEFDHEMATTRITLERAPNDKFDYRPHPKSMALRGLVSHLSHIPYWAVMTIRHDRLDLAANPPMPGVANVEQALAEFDQNVAQAREAISACSDEEWLQPWTLAMGEKAIMTLPKIAVIRSFVMNHNIHHRAQLGVYYRLNDISVPSVYGPSADEGQM